jgi:CubicO group peptidase (beta-lactamase class C family)
MLRSRATAIRSGRGPRVRPALLATAALLLGLAVLSPPPAGAEQSAVASPDLAAIDRYVETERRATRIPGLALGIVRGDQMVHLRGFGHADPSGRPVTPDTPFIMASVGKSFTALAVMQLVEAGELELDAPVQRYLPWFQVADPDASARITVRHLLNQTSGLSRRTGNRSIRLRDLSDGALEREVRALRDAELSAPVGETWQYSNPNYATLGLIVQTVARQPYEDYLHERVFTPLDMGRSFARPEDAHRHGLATGHEFWFGRARPTPPRDLYNSIPNRAHVPAGLISSSVEDMAHYLIAQQGDGSYRGRRVLSPAGIADLHRPAVNITATEAYAMGWVVTRQELSGKTVRTLGHDGGTGDFYAEMTLVPDGQWGVVLLTNGGNALQGERVPQIADGVVAQLLGLQPPPTPFPQTTAILLVLVGALVLQVVGIARFLILLRRWRLQPPQRPHGAWMWTRRVVLPLALGLTWAALCLVILPAPQGVTVAQLSLNDVGLTLLVSGGIALAWSLIRTAVILLTLRSRNTRPSPAAPAPDGVRERIPSA